MITLYWLTYGLKSKILLSLPECKGLINSPALIHWIMVVVEDVNIEIKYDNNSILLKDFNIFDFLTLSWVKFFNFYF